MSYVLDALKKAERERRQQKDLGLDNLEQEDWLKPHESGSGGARRYLWWLVPAFLCIALAVFITLSQYLWLEKPVESDLLQGSDLAPVNIAGSSEIVIFEKPENIHSDNFEEEQTEKISLSEIAESMHFEGSLYIQSNPGASRVFIDGQSYYAGDDLSNNVYIKDITPNSVILSDGYEELIRPLR